MASEIYVPASVDEVRDTILADLRNEMISRGLSDDPPVQEGTDLWLWAHAEASISMLQFGNIASHAEDDNPVTATGDGLLRWKKALGLPDVPAAGSSGKIRLKVSGIATVADGDELTLPNGKRLEVVGNWIGVTNNAEIDVRAIDTGEATNAAAGTVVRFVSAPLNVDTEAKVSVNVPLTGGVSAEDEPRLRTRVLNEIQNKPSGGNWSDKRKAILDNFLQVQNAFVYPALGGPASERIAICKAFNRDLNDYSRQLTSDATADVRDLIHEKFPSPDEIVVDSVVDETTDVSVLVTIPDAVSAGGNGTGWSNSTVWPTLEVADAGRVSVSSVTSTTVIVVSANTATAPTANITKVAWWSPTVQRFYRRLVVAQSGSAGAWTLTLDQPLVDDAGVSVAAGDYVCPDATNLESYGSTFVDIMEQLGPGENTTDANRLPRSKRHPYVTDSRSLSQDLKTSQLELFSRNHSEITDYEYGYRSSSTPTVPASVATAPNVLVPRHFGVYSQ